MAREQGSVVVPGDVNKGITEAMNCWQEAGYESKGEATVAAAKLWRALYDQGFFKSRQVCETFIRSPQVFLMGKYIL